MGRGSGVAGHVCVKTMHAHALPSSSEYHSPCYPKTELQYSSFQCVITVPGISSEVLIFAAVVIALGWNIRVSRSARL